MVAAFDGHSAPRSLSRRVFVLSLVSLSGLIIVLAAVVLLDPTAFLSAVVSTVHAYLIYLCLAAYPLSVKFVRAGVCFRAAAYTIAITSPVARFLI